MTDQLAVIEADKPVLTPMQQSLWKEAFAIEMEDAQEANTIGYYSRLLAQITMPHRDPKTNEFKRTNGIYTLTIMSPSEIGIPYGNIPRLLLAWISTEVVRTKNQQLFLGSTMSEFFDELGLGRATGGRHGNITRFRTQASRLFASHITSYKNSEGNLKLNKIDLIKKTNLWWDPKSPNQETLFESSIYLHQDFYDEIINAPVPIDMRALKAVKNSPMKIDILTWLTYRLPNMMKDNQPVSWEALLLQFGAGYASDRKGKYSFKKAFLQALKDVNCVYKEAKIVETKTGIMLKKSPPLVPFKTPR